MKTRIALPATKTSAFASAKDWEAYLSKNVTDMDGIWLKLAKKASGVASVTYDEALEVALCYGWIDGQKKPCDDTYWLQKFTPRGPKSIWSKRNREIAENLITNGKMQPLGLKQVEAAKKDGRWDKAYDSPKNMVVPEDFLSELAKKKLKRSLKRSIRPTPTPSPGGCKLPKSPKPAKNVCKKCLR